MSDPAGMAPFVSDVATPRVRFGAGELACIGDEVDRLAAKRVLVISTRSAADAVDAVTPRLGQRLVEQIRGVAMHVPVEVVADAQQRAEGSGADLLLCIGGGSAIGLAKALALNMKLPIVAVPTTYAGSEMTDIWGRSEGDTKVTGRDRAVLPRVVVYDPLLTLDFPPELSATSGMNALAHCVEALYSPSATPVTSMYAHESIEALCSSLPRVIVDPHNVHYREGALFGACLAGWALNATTMGLHHKLCHVLGGFGLPHAGVHSVLLPYVVAWVSSAAPQVTEQLSVRHFAGTPPWLGLWELGRRLGTPSALTSVGYRADLEDEVVRHVLASPPESPRVITESAVRAILSDASVGAEPAAQA